jgi:alpha-tubulin suppressor-like RCC1 family protein
VWTAAGELFTFGHGGYGKLGHGGTHDERVPRRLDEPAGKRVVVAAAGYQHTACVTAVWTEQGKLFTFGIPTFGIGR